MFFIESGYFLLNAVQPCDIVNIMTKIFFITALAITPSFFSVQNTFAVNHTLPVGHLDFASENSVYGWAYDSDAGSAPLTVHIYVDNVPTVALVANQRRDDLLSAGVAPDPFHGFSWAPQGLSSGTHIIRAFAINIPQGFNPELLSAKTINISQNKSPTGVLDFATPARFSGWAYDPEAGTNPIGVHFYIDGKFAGATLANEKRDDLVVAGVAADPFHGFWWIPPLITPGTHTVTAWAINSPQGHNPELRSSPKTMTLAQDTPAGILFLENSVMKVGANLNWGGAISTISHRDNNIVDDHDTGRLVQTSFYDSGENYPSNPIDSSWGWNPVQGGDKYMHGSSVLEYTQSSSEVYVKSQLLQWNPDNKGGGINQPIASPFTQETWITLSPKYPQLARVRHRIISSDSKSRRGNHEVPASFVLPFLDKVVTYSGSAPWTNASVSFPSVPIHPDIGVVAPVSEQWLAWVNADGFGLTLYVPNHTMASNAGFNIYHIDGVTSYMRPALTETISPGTPWEQTYYLILGNYIDSRSVIYQLHASGNSIF